ncbi:MAG: hypothetical protein RBU45_25645 [Myxococcota bacterium]|jgi:uncharacterized coiled-coil DUF342 family protein|nr:hypothetical protein [Myxococcota bacterium]
MIADVIAGYCTARSGTIVAVALACLLGCGLVFQRCQLADERSRRSTCEQHAEQLEQQAGAAQAQLASYHATVDEQNRQVELLRAETEKQQARVEAAERRIGETRVEYRERVRRVLMAPVPTACEAAVRWGAQQAREAAKAWRTGQ